MRFFVAILFSFLPLLTKAQLEYRFQGETGAGQLNYLRGLCYANGNLYVADALNHRVRVYKPNGDTVLSFGNFGSANGQFNTPESVVADANAIYVSDGLNNRVQKFDAAGNFLFSFGSAGSAAGQFDHPAGLTLDENGDLYVADQYNVRVQKFDSAGNFMLQFGSWGHNPGELIDVIGISADQHGHVWVADPVGRISQFDAGGNFVRRFGTPGVEFNEPCGMCVSPDNGNLFIADTYNDRVQQFDSLGNFFYAWGSAGSGVGYFIQPYSVACSRNGDSVFVSDAGNNRVQLFVLQMPGDPGNDLKCKIEGDQLIVEFSSVPPVKLHLLLYSANGQLVLDKEFTPPASFDVSGLNAQLYLAEFFYGSESAVLQNEKGKAVFKLVKGK